MYLFILATICCLVDLFALVIIKFITTCCFSESSDDQQIRKDLIALKKEMSSISMVDEFARYAKLQRKFNKLQDEAKEKMNTRSVSKMKLQWFMIGGIRILNGIFASTLLFMYRSEPVMVFPSGTLWPLEPFLSWPTGVDSCISLPLWMLLMRSSVSCCYGISASGRRKPTGDPYLSSSQYQSFQVNRSISLEQNFDTVKIISRNSRVGIRRPLNTTSLQEYT